MRFLTIVFSLLVSPTFFAQIVVDSPDYQMLKSTGQLGNTVITPNPSLSGGQSDVIVTPRLKSTACDCYIEPDTSYTLALEPNDDGSSGIINIPFDFCMYGQTYNSFYINNNGNITFGSPLATFSATAFPSVGNVIVAPFWGDVDTGQPGNVLGEVVYKITPTAVYINWVDVGYYSQQGDKRNTFQLTITNGADPVIESGNVAFCYKDMQWTTGSASGGVNGFAGVPATAGANKGDGTSFFLISRFDHAGSDFDGALGNPDGISWLDYKSFAFDVCNVGNVPPIPDGISSCDTFKVCALGDTADISIDFLSPEANQITTVTYSNGGLTTLQEINNISGNTAHIVLRIIGDLVNIGYYNVTVTATDDALPTNGITTISFVIQIDTVGSAALNPVLTPLDACDTVTLSVLNGPYDSYLWDDLTSSPTDGLGVAQDYGVTVSINGCYKRVHEFINIVEPFNINLSGPFTFCPPDTSVNVTIPDSLYYSSVTWGLSNLALDSLYSNELSQGTYTIQLVDSFGLCSKDTTFTILTQPALILQADDAICSQTYTFTTNTGGSGLGVWSTAGIPPSVPSFLNNNLNTTVNVTSYGIYQFVYTDANCGNTDTVEIIFEAIPEFNLNSDFFVCPGDEEYLVVVDSINMQSISWGITPVSEDTLFSANIGVGTYTANLLSTHGCLNDTTFTITTQQGVTIDQFDHVCGDSLEFNINSGIQVGQWSYYNSQGSVDFRDPTDLNTGLSVTEYGYYNLVFTELTCNISDTLTVEFIPYVGVDLNDSLELCAGQIAQITSNIYYPSFVDNVIWNTGETTTEINVGVEGYYTIQVSNVCNSGMDSIYVNVQVCDIELPNVFTPGGDLVNGGWKLINPQDIFKEFDCTITNRWGNIIFKFKDQYDVWLGQDLNGDTVNEGVYFYIITSKTIDDKELNKQGFIHLVR